MTPAREPPARRDDVRMLIVDPRASGPAIDGKIGDLAQVLAAGDLLVVNDAATLPASLRGRSAAGAPVELRLLGPTARGTWHAVVFGDGDWRTPTEHRPPPPALAPGDRLTVDDGDDEHDSARGATAQIVARADVSPRLIELAFDRDGPALWDALYRAGRPVQYSYLREDLALWSVQTVYGSRPWAAEMPSAGRGLTWSILLALRRRVVGVAAITHAAGLSSTGDPELDRALPLPERFDVPASTVAAVSETRTRGGRVIAVGTTVVRALEGCAAAHGGVLVPATGETDLVIGAGFSPRVVDGVLTGVHDPSESHYALLGAFAAGHVLDAAWQRAVALGYRSHEFGDASLILPGASHEGVPGRAGRARVSSRAGMSAGIGAAGVAVGAPRETAAITPAAPGARSRRHARVATAPARAAPAAALRG